MAAARFPDSAYPFAGQVDLRTRIACQKASGLKESSSGGHDSHSSNVRPSIMNQNLHLVDQTLHPRLMCPPPPLPSNASFFHAPPNP